MHDLEIRESVEKKFQKLAKKDPVHLLQIRKKIDEIRKNPTHHKNLRRPMQHLRRAHVGSSYIQLMGLLLLLRNMTIMIGYIRISR
jgi:mRNA-degrading endonuclease RelE of RelBE toxin-antitoxin system